MIGLLMIWGNLILVHAGGTNPVYTCNTRYPIVLSHGMGAQYEIAWGITHYWNNIPKELREAGAEVYITSVNSMDGTASKAAAWKRQLLEIIAVSGKSKVNLVGHSHGSIYSRYAISNLGVANYIASHTSIAGPHKGSSIAEVILGLVNGNILEDVANGFFGLIMSDTNSNTVQNLKDLTRNYMVNVFNPNTPNMPSIYYQSWAYRIKNIIGAGMFLPTWQVQKKLEGENDGLVAIESAKWGNFRGVVEDGPYGVNHLSAVDMLFGITPGFDSPGHFVSIVSDLKKRGF
ncbi:MAG: alpha/beta hydrolase [Desulfobacterales bacterium]|nr:alpha/beta hydrolase [Desulfobacterales bacterium]